MIITRIIIKSIVMIYWHTGAKNTFIIMLKRSCLEADIVLIGQKRFCMGRSPQGGVGGRGGGLVEYLPLAGT